MVKNRVVERGTYLRLYNTSSKKNSRFFIHRLNLIDRMRYMKTNADYSKHGCYLMVSIFRKEVFRNKMQIGFKVLTGFKSSSTSLYSSTYPF